MIVCWLLLASGTRPQGRLWGCLSYYAKARRNSFSRAAVCGETRRDVICICSGGLLRGRRNDKSHSARAQRINSRRSSAPTAASSSRACSARRPTASTAAWLATALTLVVVLDKVPHYAEQGVYISDVVAPRGQDRQTSVLLARRCSRPRWARRRTSRRSSPRLGLGLDDQSHEVLLQIEASYVTRATMPRIECTDMAPWYCPRSSAPPRSRRSARWRAPTTRGDAPRRRVRSGALRRFVPY